MSLRDYLKNQFKMDLMKLSFEKPNTTILSNPEIFNIDEKAQFFGGRDGENLVNEIMKIEENNRLYFILGLFSIITIDLTMHTYYKEYHANYRKSTAFPHFGYSGFGVHFNKPKYLLNQQYNLTKIDNAELESIIDDYVNIFNEDCTNAFSQHFAGIEIDVKDFLSKMLNDKWMLLTEDDEDTLYSKVYTRMRDILL